MRPPIIIMVLGLATIVVGLLLGLDGKGLIEIAPFGFVGGLLASFGYLLDCEERADAE